MQGGFLEQFVIPCGYLSGHTENKISKCTIKALKKVKKKNLSIYMLNEGEAGKKLTVSKDDVVIPKR